MNLPNFVVIGAPKCGTTSIYKYLQQHPQIYLSPIKETNFFASSFIDGEPQLDELDFCYGNLQKMSYPVTSFEDYQALFEGVTDEKAIGEVSPSYFQRPMAVERIKKHIPKAKLIAILRNPVDRAYSGYQMQVRMGRETRKFEQNIGLEEIYIQGGFYYEPIKRYIEAFGPDRLLILLYQDLKRDPKALMQTIFQFLDVDPKFTPDVSVRYNSGGIPKNGGIYSLVTTSKASELARSMVRSLIPQSWRSRLFTAVESKMLTKPQPLSTEIRQQLENIYSEDVAKLQALLQRELWSK